jgi:septum formation protein
MPHDFVYLASQSPRRRQLLEQLGIRHELLLPDPDEDAEALEAVRPGEAPAAYVQRVTGLKLDAALARLARRGLPPAPVLCSDTTVALGRDILGKPADAAEARRMLARLSGRPHRVLTAVALQTGPRGAVGFARAVRRHDARADPRLRGHRRAHGQGWRLRRARPGRGFHCPHQLQLLWHHGFAHARDRRAAAGRRREGRMKGA